jgi:hypothetical protein
VYEKQEFKRPYHREYGSLQEIENIIDIDIMCYTGDSSVVQFEDEEPCPY